MGGGVSIEFALTCSCHVSYIQMIKRDMGTVDGMLESMMLSGSGRRYVEKSRSRFYSDHSITSRVGDLLSFSGKRM